MSYKTEWLFSTKNYDSLFPQVYFAQSFIDYSWATNTYKLGGTPKTPIIALP